MNFEIATTLVSEGILAFLFILLNPYALQILRKMYVISGRRTRDNSLHLLRLGLVSCFNWKTLIRTKWCTISRI